jgi:uncharacterized DUF497 family protein
MRLHDNFEWDEDKARKNVRKHGVSFDDAALVLADEEGDSWHVEEYDSEHSSSEDRYVTTASHPTDRSIVLIVAWTDRSTETAKITHIISARAATRAERNRYVKEIGGR